MFQENGINEQVSEAKYLKENSLVRQEMNQGAIKKFTHSESIKEKPASTFKSSKQI